MSFIRHCRYRVRFFPKIHNYQNIPQCVYNMNSMFTMCMSNIGTYKSNSIWNKRQFCANTYSKSSSNTNEIDQSLFPPSLSPIGIKNITSANTYNWSIKRFIYAFVFSNMINRLKRNQNDNQHFLSMFESPFL